MFGSTTLRLTDGSKYDIGGEWAQISLFGAVSKTLGEEVSPATCRAELLGHAERVSLAMDPGRLPGKLVKELVEHLVVPEPARSDLREGLSAWTPPADPAAPQRRGSG